MSISKGRSMKVSEMNVSDDVRAKRALEKLRPQLASLRAEDVVQVNLEISGAVQTILGALPAARALRKQMVTQRGLPPLQEPARSIMPSSSST